MSRQIDFDKPLSDEDKLWLHKWGQDWKIEENERRFAQSDTHLAGELVSVPDALADAGLEVPEPPVNPTPQQAVSPQPESFDEEAIRAEVEELTVAELRANLKDFGEPTDGVKAELQERLLAALRKDG